MKRIISLFLCVILCISVFMTTASAATTYTDYNWDFSSNHNEVWFADIVYKGEIVGFGYLHYNVSNGIFGLFKSCTLETEYQNYDMPRSFGSDNGIDVKVYARIIDSSGSSVVSDTYSWSDEDNTGGNSLGWISVEVKLSNDTPSYLGGFVSVTLSSGATTYAYRVYGDD